MIRIILIALATLSINSLSFGQMCNSPTATTYTNGNNIHSAIRNGGDLFWDGSDVNFQAPFDTAATQQSSTIFTASLWLGGQDGGNLALASQLYRSLGTDYFSGPLDTATANIVSATCDDYDIVWKVKKQAIDFSIQDYLNNGQIDYPIDTSLLIWPGYGNPHFAAIMGFSLVNDRDLAPFYDRNADGIYDPMDGDYPVFEHGNADAIAAEVLWAIFNDNGNVHAVSNANPTKSEVHLTAYSLSCPQMPLLNNVLFTKHKIINRNTVTLDSFYMSLFADFDLGCFQDDYIGTDTSLNTIYAYNGDEIDDVSCSGTLGYGNKPPAQSITFLSHPISSSTYTSNGADLSTGLEMYRAMQGLWGDGTPMTPEFTGYNPGSTLAATPFAFTGDPATQSDWTMTSPAAGILPQDYRMVASSFIGDWLPGQEITLDIAYTFHRDTTLTSAADMTTLIAQDIPQIQQLYDGGFNLACVQAPLAISPLANQPLHVRAYPNPFSDAVTIEVLDNNKELTLQLSDLTGRIVRQLESNGDQPFLLNRNDLPEGLYFYSILHGGQRLHSAKLMIKD